MHYKNYKNYHSIYLIYNHYLLITLSKTLDYLGYQLHATPLSNDMVNTTVIYTYIDIHISI